MAEEETLVSRRPKRSTAGNRMELALAELALEEPQEVEEDVDFVVQKDEEDVFESDFASTDEEAAQEDVDEGDRTVREEERRERMTARARVEKAAAAAHARQRVTFDPEAMTTSQSRARAAPKSKRRVSLGAVVNAETGEVIEGGAGTVGAKRQSKRRHTVMNTSATVNRIKDAEEKRAAIPKKTKMATRLPTQDELIARALDTEEGNITEHKNYLLLEEEKRAKARVVKKAIEGPVLRWISKKETIQVEVQLPPPPPMMATTNANLYAAKYSFVYPSGVGGTVGSQAYSMPFYTYTPLVAQGVASKPQEAGASASATTSSIATPSLNGNPTAAFSAGTPTVPGTPVAQSTPSLLSTPSSIIQNPATPITGTSSSAPPTPSWQQQPQPQTQAQPQTQLPPVLFSYSPTFTPTAPYTTNRTEDVCKNYLIHELSQSTPSKPPWKDTMTAIFGDHVQWDEVKVLTGKGRPLARPVRTCPITGQPAKYCDPRTNVPFSNVGAYQVLTKVLGRGYVWCSALGCYVGVNETSRMDRRLGGKTEGSASASAGTAAHGVDAGTSVAEVVAGGQDGNTGDGAKDLEERTAKRRKVEVTDSEA